MSSPTLAGYMWSLSRLHASEKGVDATGFFLAWVSYTEIVLDRLKRVSDAHPDDLTVFVRDDLNFRECIVDEYWAVLAPIAASPADCGADLEKCKTAFGSVINFPSQGFETRDRVIARALYSVLLEFHRPGKQLAPGEMARFLESFKQEIKKYPPTTEANESETNELPAH